MELIILLLLVVGVYALHRDHIVLAESLDSVTDALDKIIKHLDIKEEVK